MSFPMPWLYCCSASFVCDSEMRMREHSPSLTAYMTETQNGDKNGEKNKAKQNKKPNTLQTRTALFCLTALQMTSCWKWSGWGRKLFPCFCHTVLRRQAWLVIFGWQTNLLLFKRKVIMIMWSLLETFFFSLRELLTIASNHTQGAYMYAESSKMQYRSSVI